MTRYRNKAGHDYLDFKSWALGKWTDPTTRDNMLKNIYLSAKMMKYHPQMTKDLRKTYGLVASAAMRAMSPEAKYLMKQKMSPYSQLKAKYAKDVAEAREKYGIIPRKGLAGRIGYWNSIQATDITDMDGALQDLYGVEPDVTKKPEFKPKDIYSGTYAQYKAKLKEKSAARRQLMDRMTEAQRKDYKHRLMVLQAARLAMKEARKKEREQRRTRDSLAWGKMTMKDWADDYKREIEQAIANKGDKYSNIKMEDIYAVMSDPKGSLFKSYMRANPGIAQQESRRTPDRDMGALSLTSRADVDWKGDDEMNFDG